MPQTLHADPPQSTLCQEVIVPPTKVYEASPTADQFRGGQIAVPKKVSLKVSAMA